MRIQVALAALLALAQEKEDPRFKYWSGCKTGSWVKMVAEMEQGGQKMRMEQIQKLVEVSDSKVKLETSGTMTMAGKDVPVAVRTQEINAKVPEDFVKVDQEGDEEIEVGGKKLKCHWVELMLKTGANKTKTKVWLSSEIPGGSAKVEVTPTGQPRVMVFTAVEWEKK